MQTFSNIQVLPFLLSVVVFFFACQTTSETLAQNEQSDWSVSAPEAVGMDKSVLDSMHGEITSGKYGLIDHVLVIRNGKLLFDEHYKNDYPTIAQKYDPTNFQYNYDHPDWHPYYQGTGLHSLQSCTKSITSLLVGIAVDEGLISDVDIKVMQLFKAYQSKDADPRKNAITLRDLLTMRGGFEWDEHSIDYTDPKNSCYILESSADWLDYLLNLPMATEPGTEFVYNSGITVLLGEIIRIKTGKRVDKWAEEKLFQPLNIQQYYWKLSPNGEVDTEGGLYLSVYDFAKIGQLVLNQGKWQGKTIVSKDWLDESTTAHVAINDYYGYGYQWWVMNPREEITPLTVANGYGGQFLFIDYENNLLTVTNAWNIHDAPEKSPYSLLYSLSDAIRD